MTSPYESRRERIAARYLALSRLPIIWRLGMWLLDQRGMDIPRRVVLGKDVRFPHARNVVIHPTSVIGDRVIIYHNVTLGANRTRTGPIVEDDVLIGTGAVVLGPVRLGKGCKIGANSIVEQDVPAGAIYRNGRVDFIKT